MPVVPAWQIAEQETAAGVNRAQAALRSEVVRIRYSFGEDWTGDPSIFFRVLLTDEAADLSTLAEVRTRVEWTIDQEVQSENFGYHSYFSVRSKSEQDEMNDPEWA